MTFSRLGKLHNPRSLIDFKSILDRLNTLSFYKFSKSYFEGILLQFIISNSSRLTRYFNSSHP